MGAIASTLALAAGARIDIDQGAGAAAVLGWDQPDVRLTLTMEGGDPTPFVRIEQGPGGLRVETVDRAPAPVSVLVQVPARLKLGVISVDTGSGALHLAQVSAGEIRVDGGSGQVRLEGCAARRCVLDTGSGGVSVHRCSADELRVDAGSGRVDVELAAVRPQDRVIIDAGSGGVILGLPEAAAARVRVETRPGRFRSEFTHQSLVTDGGGEVTVRLGPAGDPAAELRVDSSGPVLLRPAAGVQVAVAAAAPVVDEEALARVLQMVQSGRLSPDEAEALLQALDGAEGAKEGEPT